VVEASSLVLVVEDDPALREMLVELLREDGLQVCAVGGAGDALRAVRETQFDLILSDIQMPEMDGFELLDAVREVRPEARVILMTSFGSSAFASRAERGGALAYLSKPFSREQLEAALQLALAA
jgi:two-component system response regulator FlrC